MRIFSGEVKVEVETDEEMVSDYLVDVLARLKSNVVNVYTCICTECSSITYCDTSRNRLGF
jgi:hypothetical protein